MLNSEIHLLHFSSHEYTSLEHVFDIDLYDEHPATPLDDLTILRLKVVVVVLYIFHSI
jgi:hypothetical protein